MTKFEKQYFSHVQRPFEASYIEDWRSSHGLSMDDATYALGLANYKKKLKGEGLLSYSLELLMRLYDENPGHGVWPGQRITLNWLFDEMYAKSLAPFIGTDHEKAARVDLQKRFAKLFGRSKGRAHRWLDERGVDASINNRTQEEIQGILGKLSQLKNPGETLERLGRFVWALRGEDIDTTHRIPTLKYPPFRQRRGRKPGSKMTSNSQVRRVIAPGVDIRIKDISRLTATDPLKNSRRSAPKAAHEDVAASRAKKSVTDKKVTPTSRGKNV